MNSTVNYLSPLLKLEDYGVNYKSQAGKSVLYQMFANYYALVNETDSADYYWNKFIELNESRQQAFVEENQVNSVSPKVLELSKDNAVLMFNEAHTKPKHRYYIGTLLKDFYGQGYRYLALEALAEDDAVNQLGYPSIKSGFYINEPAMGNLVRHAKKLGYQLIAYDDASSNREYMQAKNIYDKTLKQDSLAKVVVLAGHGHINESNHVRKQRMAAHFRKISGINPITIDQTSLEKYSFSESLKGKSFVLKDDEKDTLDIQTDLKVFNTYNINQAENCFGSSESKSISIFL